MGHASAQAYHADAQPVRSAVGGPERFASSQAGGRSSGGGVLQETTAIERVSIH